MRYLASITAAVGLAACATAATAADLAVRRPLPPPPTAVWSWTGFYLGGHVGAGWGTTEAEVNSITVTGAGLVPLNLANAAIPIGQNQTNGFLGGVQGGFNWQVASWAVIGVEADVSWSDIKGTSSCIVIFNCRTNHDWLATAAGRFGVTYDRALFYVKGGAAWAQSEYSASLALPGVVSVNLTNDKTRVGALFGTGIEYAFLPNWSAKVEYNYIDFGTETYNFPLTVVAPAATVNFGTGIHERLHLVKAGLNFRFGGGPAYY
jgi:outer membrane immunogenic protein